MKRLKKILVAVDTRLASNPIVATAAALAKENDGHVQLIDIVPPFSWFSRYATPDTEHLADLLEKEKAEQLKAMEETVRSQSVEVSSRVLRGATSEEIIKEALRGEHDLVMAVAKGRNSTRNGHFGQTASRLLRQCPCALWLVSPDAPSQPKHVLSCIDPSKDEAVSKELDERVIELGQSISSFYNARLSILHAWHMEDEKLLARRLSQDSIAKFLRDELHYHKKKLNSFLAQYNLSSDSDEVNLVKGKPAETIADTIESSQADLLVMGTNARTGVSGFFIGNTAEKVLSKAACSVLALKPNGFNASIYVDARG